MIGIAYSLKSHIGLLHMLLAIIRILIDSLCDDIALGIVTTTIDSRCLRTEGRTFHPV